MALNKKQKSFKKKSKKSFLPLLGGFFILLTLISLTLIVKDLHYRESMTGNAVFNGAQGGNVTYLNTTKINASGHWQGYFGEIATDASASMPSAAAHRGNVTSFNLTLPCLGNEIYAATLNNLTFDAMKAGTKEMVDLFLNLNSNHLESGSKVFTASRDFVVSSILITDIPTTFMKVSGSGSSPFALGILNHSNDLVFLGNVSLNSIGFDGNTHDYQIMVPVNQSELTYYFFSDCEVEAAAVPSAPSVGAAAGGGVAGSLVGYCGDKVCQLKETCASCPADCGICPANISKETPKMPENITIKETFKEELPSVPLNIDKIVKILEKQLFTIQGLAILLFVIIALLLTIAWKVLKLRDRPPRLVFLKK